MLLLLVISFLSWAVDVTIRPDMLRLSAKGYQIWAEATPSTLKELLAKPQKSVGSLFVG